MNFKTLKNSVQYQTFLMVNIEAVDYVETTVEWEQ